MPPSSRDAERHVREVLGSSLKLGEVMRAAQPLLCQILRADYGALGVTVLDEPGRFEWLSTDLPPAFFGAYEEMAPHDFVRRAVAEHPNIVLRDEEMISRRDLESNIMHHRARDIGAPLEQVMSIMLHVGDAWSSGISFYRAERRPFSDRERLELQNLAPALANAVRNCRYYGLSERRSQLFEHLFENQRQAAIALGPSGREVARTASATTLIESWFPAIERAHGQLPFELLERARSWHPDSEPALLPWTVRGDSSDLVVKMSSLADRGRPLLVISMEEVPRFAAADRSWQGVLTAREREVSVRVAEGWSNRVIAEALNCSEGTVKKHLQHIFDKLGVSSRTQLIARIRATPLQTSSIAG